MSTTVTLDDAAGRLRELIAAAAPGQDIALTCDGKVVATLRCAPRLPTPEEKAISDAYAAEGVRQILALRDEIQARSTNSSTVAPSGNHRPGE